MRRFNQMYRILRNNDGFTIVELLVAAAIVLVATGAVVAVVRKSSEIQVNGVHRLQARNVIMGYFESDFDDRRFSKDAPSRYGVAVGRQNVPIPVDGEWKPNAAGAEFVLDDGGGGGAAAFRGYISFRAQAGSAPIGDYPIPYHEITIKVRWTEAVGNQDSAALTKRLADTHDSDQ
jgi:prepilin-type N-terminal cleavage/methylation domain-containing protein